MKDDNGQQMAVTNVIGLYMDVSTIAGDGSGRRYGFKRRRRILYLEWYL